MGAGSSFWFQGSYTQGALSYIGLGSYGQANTFYRFDGNTVGAAWGLDGIFNGQSGVELTSGASVGGGLEHYWTNDFSSTVFSNFSYIDYSGTAKNWFCSSPLGPIRTAAGGIPTFVTGAVPGCDPSFSLLQVGVRTNWNPYPNLDVGLQLAYQRLNTAFDARTVRLSFFGAAGLPVGLFPPTDEDIWSATVRIQRNFWP